MQKVGIIIIASLFLFILSFSSFSFTSEKLAVFTEGKQAADKDNKSDANEASKPAGKNVGMPVEMPDIKFIVNNKRIVLSDIPIGINGRTLLPLRAVLVSLGVPDDDEHIRWDGDDKSVTVVYGGNKICLKVGSTTAYINDGPVAMDVAPLIYSKNQRTYIPVRFVSNAVGKGVAWDEYTRTVYIRDKKEFDIAGAVLRKVDASMNSTKKVRINSTIKLDISGQGADDTNVSFDVGIREEVDRSAGTLYSAADIPLFNGAFSFISFYIGNSKYTKIASSNAWHKTYMPEKDFNAALSEDTSLSTFNSVDVMAACMDESAGGDPDELIMKGDVYPKGLADDIAGILNSKETDSVKADKYNIEAVIDKDTWLVKKLVVILEGEFPRSETSSYVKAHTTAEFADYDGDFDVTAPDGLLID